METETVAKGEAVLLQQAREQFAAVFHRQPAMAAVAPGRVNLMGDHIDYCEGFVLPVALPFMTVMVGALNGTEECNLVSTIGDSEVKTTFPASSSSKPLRPGPPAWANYVKGVVANFPGGVSGFDAVIRSDVPIGAGLSSSAALEVATFTLLEGLTGRTSGLVEKARLCQKAEHEFPCMPCGIMDQYIVTMGKKHHALLIDCRSLEAEQIPVQLGELAILVINSNVKHKLTGSEYPQRRAQCQEAAERLGLPSLRNAKTEDLQKLKEQSCPDIVLMRAKHVIDEIYRTEEIAKMMKIKDFKRVGQLMWESHDSLSKLMQVSCPELDQIVDILKGMRGVYGARMTGGGFGGCVVALTEKNELSTVKSRILSQYEGSPTFFLCQPSDGARLVKL